MKTSKEVTNETTCPDCKEPFQLEHTRLKNGDDECCTVDCPNCGSILILWNGEARNFYVFLGVYRENTRN